MANLILSNWIGCALCLRTRKANFKARLRFNNFIKVLGEPWMSPNLFQSIPSCWICVQNFLNEISGLTIYEIGYRILALKNFLVKLTRIWIFKGQIAADHGVQDDTT